MENITNFIEFVNKYIAWGPHLVISIIVISIYLTIKTNFIQFRGFKKGLSLLFKRDKISSNEVSRFGALCTSLAATIGTGNIVGVAFAIGVGGPGALFWMIFAAFFSMATSYAEGMLAIKYRIYNEAGFVGGPFYYIERGLGKKFKFLAVMFSACAVYAGTFGIGTTIQANSISLTVSEYFKNCKAVFLGYTINYATAIFGAVITVLVALVILGGIKRISKVAEIFVPFMSIVYIIISLTVIITNIKKLPSAIDLIFNSAFNPRSVLGATSGITFLKAIQLGTSRGIFSNEAGLGSGAIASAAAKGSEPVEQGLVSMLGPFIDTVVLCSITGLGLIVTDAWKLGGSGTEITLYAWKNGLPINENLCNLLLMILVMFFAFSSIIGWNYYTEKSLSYLCNDNKRTIKFHRIIYIFAVFVAPYVNVHTVWTVADIFNAFMAVPNLISLVLLSGIVNNSTKGYFKRLH